MKESSVWIRILQWKMKVFFTLGYLIGSGINLIYGNMISRWKVCALQWKLLLNRLKFWTAVWNKLENIRKIVFAIEDFHGSSDSFRESAWNFTLFWIHMMMLWSHPGFCSSWSRSSLPPRLPIGGQLLRLASVWPPSLIGYKFTFRIILPLPGTLWRLLPAIGRIA